MSKKKVPLDELELMVELIKASTNNDTLTYAQLANAIKEEFDVEVDERDIFLIYEPTIQNDVVDSEILLNSIYGYQGGCGYLELPNRKK